jgi:hypothetical protein
LEARRIRLREQHEKTAREKVEEYKRQRREEIERRSMQEQCTAAVIDDRLVVNIDALVASDASDLRTNRGPNTGDALSQQPNRNETTGSLADLSASSKARRAEEVIMHLYKPPPMKTREQRAQEIAEEKIRKQRELEDAYDAEVEARLWEVERVVMRKRDEELSRAEMAELAELRARKQLSQYYSKFAAKDNSRSPPKPSYIPKMNRLQPI